MDKQASKPKKLKLDYGSRAKKSTKKKANAKGEKVGEIKAPTIRIKQRKNESKRDFNKRVKEWKKSSKKWQEYEKAKKREAQRNYYEKNKERLKKRREAKKARERYYGENILGVPDYQKASKSERDRFRSNINNLKEMYAHLGTTFEKELYKEIGNFYNNVNSKSATDKLSATNDMLEKKLSDLQEDKNALDAQLDRWEEIEDEW